MSRRHDPPQFARRLVERALPTHMRDDVSGDMDELFRVRAERNGRVRAVLWYWVQALSFTLRFFRDRMRPSDSAFFATPHRSTMKSFSWLDWKLGARMLLKYPALSLISVAALATAISVGVGIFYFVDRELNPHMPFAHGDRIVTLAEWDALASKEEGRILSDVAVWRDQLKSVDMIGAYRTFERNLVGVDGRAHPVRAAEITSAMFPVTETKPLLGRELTDADEQVNAPAVVVIGYDVWQERFNGDRSIIGRSIQLGSENATVVGVMPEHFAFPRVEQLWMPLRARGATALQGPSVSVFARLSKGATIRTAQAELAVIGRNLAASDPATHERLQPEVRRFGVDHGNRNRGLIVLTLYLSSLMVVLAACANVATLVFARTAMRESEIVVRNALGASRGRVMAQLFVESLVLALVAAGVGLAIFDAFLRFLHYQVAVVRDVPQPFWYTESLSVRAVLVALGLAVFGAAIVGLLPAIKATGSRVQNALHSIRGGGAMKFGGVWSVIIVLQVALTVLCLPIGIGATRETLRDHRMRAAFASKNYLTFKSGLDRVGVLSAAGELSDEEYRTHADVAYAELMRRIAAEPGVQGVTIADKLPAMNYPLREIEARRGGEAPVVVNANTEGLVRLARVGIGFFDAFGIPVLSGRGFNNSDGATKSNSVIINESLAKNIGGNPLGVRLRYAAKNGEQPGEWYEVVGVTKNLGMEPTNRGEADFMYIPSAPSDIDEPAFAVRVSGDPNAMAARIAGIALQVDPGLRVFDVMSLEEVVHRRDLPGIVSSVGAVSLAALAVILSAACLFALMSVSVAKRTREIGVRLALGASTSGILRSVFARSAMQVGLGILVGNVVIVALIAATSNELRFDVLVPMLGVSGLMALVGLCACAIPAWRVLQVHPTEALREAA